MWQKATSVLPLATTLAAIAGAPQVENWLPFWPSTAVAVWLSFPPSRLKAVSRAGPPQSDSA